MAKIEITEDQNGVRIDDTEYHEFYGYSQLPVGHMEEPCDKCSLKKYCFDNGPDFPCSDELRKDGFCGVFKKTYTGG